MIPPGAFVNPACPVNLDHPLARGLFGVWVPFDGMAGGNTFWEILHPQTHSGVFQTNGGAGTLPSWVAGPPGGFPAVRFTAANTNRASVGTITSSGKYAVAALFRPRNLTGSQSIFMADDSADGLRLFQFRTNVAVLEGIGFDTGPSAFFATGTTTLANNTRYVGAFDYDGAAIRLYLNGKPEAGPTSFSPCSTAATTSGIGARYTGGLWDSGADHDIAAVLWWNGRALSAAEHRELAAELFAGLPNLLNWYRPRAWVIPTGGGSNVTVGLSALAVRGVPVAPGVAAGNRVTPTALAALGVPVGPVAAVGVNVLPTHTAAAGTPVAPAVRVSDLVVLGPVSADATVLPPGVEVSGVVSPSPLGADAAPVSPTVRVVTGVAAPPVSVGGAAVPLTVLVETVLHLTPAAAGAVPAAPVVRTNVVTALTPLFARGVAVNPETVPGEVIGLAPVTAYGNIVPPLADAIYRVSAAPATAVGVTVSPVVAFGNAVSLVPVSVGGQTVSVVVVGGVLILPPGDAGEFFTKPVEYAARTFFKPEEYAARVFWSDPTMPAPTETRYMTDKENKTFGFSFEREGSVRDGEVLSNPEVFIDPPGPVVGVPEVVTTDFHDSDGRRIRANKGVKVRIAEAAAGTYTLTCRVSTPSDPSLEWAGFLQVDASLGD